MEDAYDLTTWDGIRRRLYAQGEFDIDFGLSTFRRALAHWDHPERNHPVVLVGGTNGKGGVASGLDAILGAHGLTTGLFTSPHLLSFRERFRIDGRPVEQDVLEPIAARALREFGEPEGDRPQLSFFELCCVMAVETFARADVDVGIYEVGLGGRLDATNALDPVVSVLTRIGLDHTALLGDTVEEVAREVTAILREGRPGIIGPQSSEDVRGLIGSLAPDETMLDWVTTQPSDEFDRSDALVERENRQTALQAARRVADTTDTFAFDPEAGRRGLDGHVWPGRFERRCIDVPSDVWETSQVDEPVELLLDAAHNPQAIDHLVEELRRRGDNIDTVVFGSMADKEAAGMIRSMRDGLGGEPDVIGAEIDSPRAMVADTLVDAGCTVAHQTVRAVTEAIRRARNAAEHRDAHRPTILVTGSIYLIGEVLASMGVSPSDLTTRLRG